MYSKSPGMEGKHRVVSWDCKESTPCLLRRLQKRLQFEIGIFYAYNWLFWRLCGTNWRSDRRYFLSSSFSSDRTTHWWVERTIHPSASTRGSACRLAKINNADQTQWWQLMAQRRSPWRAGPDDTGGGGGGGYSTNIWVWVSRWGSKTQTQKIPELHTLFRKTSSILVPCLGQLPQFCY